VEKVAYTVEHFAQTNHVALGLGVGTILVTVLLKKINKNLPGALLGLVFCAIAVMVFNLGQFDIKLTGNIPSAIPPFQMLSFDPGMMSSLAGGAAVIAIIGLVEAVSISKSIAAQTQQKLDSNQEFIGQGVANMGGAFLGSIAGSGSFTRSAIAFQNGGRTRLAGVLTGVVVLVILLFLAPYAKYIPNAALAGVIMVVAYSMIDKKAVRKVLTSNRNDAAVLVVTFLTTILAPDLEYAIYAGVVISIALYLKDTGVAGVRMLEGTVPERLKEAPGEAATESGVTTIDLGGDLYFGSSMDFEEKLEKALAMGSRAVVVNMAGVSSIDITALEILENFVKRASREGKKVIISGVRPAICKCLEKAHITGLVGKESLFMCEREVFGALSKALSAAEVYLKQAPAAAMQTAAEAVEELRPAAAAAGRNPLAKLKDIMEGLLEEPFLRAEIHAMDVILKKV
jgi:SulP family sulfate permease